jgi:hypothetical protein
MANTVAVRSSPSPKSLASSDRRFYTGMALAMAVTVLAGFARTYYLPLAAGGPMATLSGQPMTGLVHVHGLLFTAWVLLFVVQTALVATHRVTVHQRMGVAGAVVAAAMIVVGARTAIASAARGSAPPGVDPLAFLIIPLGDMVLFATFVGAALWQRRNREAHKRLMLLAYVSILVAAVARLPGVIQLGPPGFFGLTFAFLAVAILYDRATRRRVHPVYLWGGALLVLSVPARLLLSETTAWRTFAAFLTGG